MILSLAAALVISGKPYVTHHWGVKADKKYEVAVDFPTFNGSSPLVWLANRTVSVELQKAKDYVAFCKKDQKENPGFIAGYDYQSGFNVSTFRPDLISLSFGINSYAGGAHGSNTTRPYSFGIVHGAAKQLRLQDLFKAGLKGREIVSKIVMAKLAKDERAQWVADGTVKALDKETCEAFVISAKGLEYTFDPYVMGSYAAGPVDCIVSYAELKGQLDPAGPLRSFLRGR